MTTALVSKQFVARFGEALKSVAESAGKSVSFITVPEEQGARLAQADCDRIDCTFPDRDINFNEHLFAAFEDAVDEMHHPSRLSELLPARTGW